MYSDLSHLTDDKVNELIERYYGGEATKKLIEEFALDVKSSELYKLFPAEEFVEYECEYCGRTLVSDRPSKTMAKMARQESSLYCPCCGHKPYRNCDCKNCVQAAIEQKKERLQNISDSFGTPSTQVEFQNLSFLEKVYLGSICRAYLHENMFEIVPNEKSVILAPSDTFCSDIYRDLLRANAIAVSSMSPIEAFVFDEDNWPEKYYIYKVIYNLNISANKKEVLSEILSPTYYSTNNQDEALALWRKIAVAECIEYLQYNLKKVGFEFSPGDKTYTTFDILLNDFSVSQIYGIIWKAVADSSKLYLEKAMTKRHAANTVIGACQRYAERAIISHWDLTRYGRIRDLPQSVLSEFFFNRVLGIGEMGFDMAPTIV
ncbi:MAG: hypothetical protein AB9836_03085 [Aminipila sp.]